MITASRTVTEELQQFCDMSGHPVATIWDRYNPDDRSALVHKLKIIFAPPPMPIAGVDNAAIDWVCLCGFKTRGIRQLLICMPFLMS